MIDAMEVQTLYEDDAIIVIDKPAGLRVHPARPGEPRIKPKLLRGEQGTLVDFLLLRWPHLKDVGDDALRPGIVHRLDADTSGVMVVAKTNEMFEHLKHLFQERRVEKTYLALVHGAMRERSGEINHPIGHGAHTATKRTAKKDRNEVRGEREAFTVWRLMRQYSDFALIEVSPKTGRTHQIRVHMAAIGHPIAGDPLYGSRKLVSPPGLTRLFLHASRLAFSLPGGRRLMFESDLPAELESVVKMLEIS